MKFGYWTSRDRLRWTRVATVRESSAEFAGREPRAALWSPLPVWDDRDNRWSLFYVACHAAPGDGTRFMLNHHGRIWRALSRVRLDGIGSVRRRAGDHAAGPRFAALEGLQGTDSFFPCGWATASALYGSAKGEAADRALARGPGVRAGARRTVDACARAQPRADRAEVHREPDRLPAPGGGWLAVYRQPAARNDWLGAPADGIAWGPGHALVVQPTPGAWAQDVRTPLGLVAEATGDTHLLHRVRAEPRLAAPAPRERQGDVRRRVRRGAGGVGRRGANSEPASSSRVIAWSKSQSSPSRGECSPDVRA